MRSCATAPARHLEIATAAPQVPVSLSLPDPPDLRLHARPHPDLVPVRHPDLPERPGVAGALDGCGRPRTIVRRDNCFTWLEDPAQAQRLMDRQVQSAWPELLNGIARSLNPEHEAMFQAFRWNTTGRPTRANGPPTSCSATRRSLARLYPKLVQHGLTTFLSPDVMRFLGRNIPANGNLPPQPAGRGGQRREAAARRGADQAPGRGELDQDVRQAGRRVLRVETTINDVGRVQDLPSRRRASRTPSRVGSACARGLPTCTAAPRSRRPPTTATWRHWPRSRTPPRWAS